MIGRKKKKVEKKEIQARHYDVIVRPLITEKTTVAAGQNKVVFKVRQDAGKKDIKQAVEALFGVTVEKVNTITLPGKVKRFRGQPGQRSDVKKAVVKLAEGQTIDFTAGV